MKNKKGGFFVGGVIGNVIDILFFILFFLMLVIILFNFDVVCVVKNLITFKSITMKECISCTRIG